MKIQKTLMTMILMLNATMVLADDGTVVAGLSLLGQTQTVHDPGVAASGEVPAEGIAIDDAPTTTVADPAAGSGGDEAGEVPSSPGSRMGPPPPPPVGTPVIVPFNREEIVNIMRARYWEAAEDPALPAEFREFEKLGQQARFARRNADLARDRLAGLAQSDLIPDEWLERLWSAHAHSDPRRTGVQRHPDGARASLLALFRSDVERFEAEELASLVKSNKVFVDSVLRIQPPQPKSRDSIQAAGRPRQPPPSTSGMSPKNVFKILSNPFSRSFIMASPDIMRVIQRRSEAESSRYRDAWANYRYARDHWNESSRLERAQTCGLTITDPNDPYLKDKRFDEIRD